jgi:hypothetical protein
MRKIIIISLLYLMTGCGGASENNTANVISVDDYQTSTYTIEAKDESVEGLLGNVTQDEMERVFSNSRSALLRCYEDAVYDLEEIEGNLRFEMEVASDGSVMSAYISESTVGSLETESCMLNIVRRFSFNRVPGGVAVISYPMELEAPYDHPPFIEWPDSKLMPVVQSHQSEIDGCPGGGAGSRVTLYIGKGGMVLSAGGAAASADALDGAFCIAERARGWTFEDPGDRLVKVRLDF